MPSTSNNIQTLIKPNLIKNFDLDTENEFFKPIGSTRPTGFIRSIESIGVTNFITSTWSTRATCFIGHIGTIEFFSILEDITQQLLENKHTITLGEVFKTTSNLKQYVGFKLALRRRTITTWGPNLVIALVAIDPHKFIYKNIIEDIMLDGGSNVNIRIKELWKWLKLPNLKPVVYTLGWQIKPSPK